MEAAANAIIAKKEADIAAASEISYKKWLQTSFAAEHAASMTAAKLALSKADISHVEEMIRSLQRQRVLGRWVSLNDPWEPDAKLLQSFGSLPALSANFLPATRRPVRCSPQLAALIVGHTK